MGHEAAEPHSHLAEPRSAALLKRGSVSEADFLALMQQVSVSFSAGSLCLIWSREWPQDLSLCGPAIHLAGAERAECIQIL